jgi:hypothetical protein
MADQEDRASKLAHLEHLKAGAEAAYDRMYDSRYPTGDYADAKDWFIEAIKYAEENGFTEEAETLKKRLEHVKAVFRSQFT